MNLNNYQMYILYLNYLVYLRDIILLYIRVITILINKKFKNEVDLEYLSMCIYYYLNYLVHLRNIMLLYIRVNISYYIDKKKIIIRLIL
jgi:hypothetical protein